MKIAFQRTQILLLCAFASFVFGGSPLTAQTAKAKVRAVRWEKLEIRFDSVSTEASESPESFVLYFIYYYYFFPTIKMVIQLKSSFQ